MQLHDPAIIHPRQSLKPEVAFTESLVYKPIQSVWEKIFGNRQCNFRPLEDRYNVGITSSFFFARE